MQSRGCIASFGVQDDDSEQGFVGIDAIAEVGRLAGARQKVRPRRNGTSEMPYERSDSAPTLDHGPSLPVETLRRDLRG